MPIPITQIPLERCQVIVLAAGRGTRMGCPKALMAVGGRPWWQIQHSRLQALRIPETWIVSEQVRSAIVDASPNPPRLILGDPAAPMFSSLVAGLRSLSGQEGAFVLPIDTPASTKRQTWQLLAVEHHASVPTFAGKKGHPVFLPKHWITSTLKLAERASDPASLRLDQLIGSVARLVAVDDPDVSQNLNTPEDVAVYAATR